LELPTSSCPRVLNLRYYGLVGNFSSKPPKTLLGGLEEEYYQSKTIIGKQMSGMMHSFDPLLLRDKKHPMHQQHSRSWIDTMKSLSPAAQADSQTLKNPF
jgi:hypothetical protein